MGSAQRNLSAAWSKWRAVLASIASIAHACRLLSVCADFIRFRIMSRAWMCWTRVSTALVASSDATRISEAASGVAMSVLRAQHAHELASEVAKYKIDLSARLLIVRAFTAWVSLVSPILRERPATRCAKLLVAKTKFMIIRALARSIGWDSNLYSTYFNYLVLEQKSPCLY